MNNANLDLAITGNAKGGTSNDQQPRAPSKGPVAARGTIQGTHYDPDAANANRGSTKRRAPVSQTGSQFQPSSVKAGRGKIGGQPTQSKKGVGMAAGGNQNQSATSHYQQNQSSAIVKMSELDALRNYNAMMNDKLRQRDQQDAQVSNSQQSTNVVSQAPQMSSGPSEYHQPSLQMNHQNSVANSNIQRLEDQNPQLMSSFQQQPSQPIEISPYGQNPNIQGLNNSINPKQNQPIASVVNPSQTIYRNVDRDQHQLAIVGSLNSDTPQISYENKVLEKELKQRNYQEELKRQIEERNYQRRKEEWRQTKASAFTNQPTVAHQQQLQAQPHSEMSVPQGSPMLPTNTAYNQNYPDKFNDKTFYVPQNVGGPHEIKNFDASITKQDFPDIKTRGRVFENRIDMELERHGNILTQGRDEKGVMQNKREQEQQAMKIALQKQIDEKQRKKDEAERLKKMEDMKDEQRVKLQMRELAIAEGMNPAEVPDMPGLNDLAVQRPSMAQGGATVYNQNAQSSTQEQLHMMGGSMAARKTAYAANQHSISIIGTDIGKAHLPNNIKPLNEIEGVSINQIGSPHHQVVKPIADNEKLPRTPPGQPYQLQVNTQEENLQGLLNGQNIENQANHVVHNEPRSPVNFDRAENSPSHHGSPVKNLQINTNSISNNVKDQQINELSDMVKELLREQQELKEQINLQAQSTTKNTRLMGPASRKGQALNKKASERVPRQQNSRGNDLMVPSTHSERGQNKYEEKDPEENPRDYLNIPLSNQPGVGKPKDNIK